MNESAERRATYRNTRPYDFCPGCSHHLILDALDRALVRLQWDPADVVIVSDIGCVGLSDQYFATSAFHGLHGRSLTYATGIKLARPDLHVINLIGDGGCGIGCAHLVSAARRNIGVTTLVFNNLNFGMTGGEHSVTTLPAQKTTTTPWGNTELPLDIAQTVAANGATYVWRGTAFDPSLDQQIEAALTHDGFGLLDIWELCVAYCAAMNKVTPQSLVSAMEALGFERGMIRGGANDDLQSPQRAEGAKALQVAWTSWCDAGGAAASPALDVRFASRLDGPVNLMIAGAAGTHVRTAGRLVNIAATLSGLWAAQRDDYPVTVRSGYSVSEVLISPEALPYVGGTRPNVLFVLAEEGYRKVAGVIEAMTPADWIFVTPDLVDRMGGRPASPQLRVLDLGAIKGIARSGWALAAVAAGLGYLAAADSRAETDSPPANIARGNDLPGSYLGEIVTPEALIEAAGMLGATYAQANRDAVRAAVATMMEGTGIIRVADE